MSKLISLILALIMVLFSVSAFAEGALLLPAPTKRREKVSVAR